jgi:1-acyl-sn-glycerol-3-phosphate acyltransferase
MFAAGTASETAVMSAIARMSVKNYACLLPAMNVTASVLAVTAKLLSGATVRWHECQPDTCQRVYFANHTSHLDALVVWSSLPGPIRELTRPVAAKDYWSKGAVRRYMAQCFNALLIDREEIKVHQSPVDMMIREIGNKHSLIVFPVGRRNTEDEML